MWDFEVTVLPILCRIHVFKVALSQIPVDREVSSIASTMSGSM